MGNFLYSSSKSYGIPLFSYWVLHLIKAAIAAKNPFVIKLLISYGNLKWYVLEMQPVSIYAGR